MGTSNIVLLLLLIFTGVVALLFIYLYYCTKEKFGGRADVKADIVPALKFTFATM